MSKQDKQMHKEARKPDLFIQVVDKILLSMKPYMKAIYALGVLTFGVGLAWTLMNWQRQKMEQTAQESYFVAERSYVKSQEETEKAKAKIKTLESSIESIKKDKKNNALKQVTEKQKELEAERAKLPTGDFEKDHGKNVIEFKSVIVKYPKSNAALMSSLYLSKILSEAKKPEEALIILTQSGLDTKKDNLLSGLYQMRLGQIYADAQDCSKAVETWQKIIQDEKLGFLHGDANLKMAVCYETLSMPDKALDIYSKNGSEGIEDERIKKIKRLILKKRVAANIVSSSTGEVLVPKHADITETVLNKLTSEDLRSVSLVDKAAQSELDKIEQATREKKSSSAVKNADKFKRILSLGKSQPNG
ncbi:MAG: hypothetical protein SGJ18_03210 [Pseudomonadota bacterium]|nr:hypothetical protein [Pseudomonadota bacterium]